MIDADQIKKIVAKRALDFVIPHMKVGFPLVTERLQRLFCRKESGVTFFFFVPFSFVGIYVVDEHRT
jgi:hypothetical protein